MLQRISTPVSDKSYPPLGSPSSRGGSREKTFKLAISQTDIFTKQVNELISASPTLVRDLDTIIQKGWKLRISPPESGSVTNSQQKTIFLSRAVLADPAHTVRVLSHEIGHVLYPPPRTVKNRLDFIQVYLKGEGAATLKNIQVQQEILTHLNKDIGVAADSRNKQAYQKIYHRYLEHRDYDCAIEQIGAIYRDHEVTSNTGNTYGEYYANAYDNAAK